MVPAQEAGGEAKEAASSPQEEEEEEDGVRRVRPSSLAVGTRRVTPEPPVSPGDKMHSNVQSLLANVHGASLFEQLKKQIPFCGCGADLCSRCLSICRRHSRMHLNYLRLCVKKRRPMSRIFELGNSPLTRPVHPDAIIVGDVGENGKPVQIFEPDGQECLHVCNILFVQYVLVDLLRLLEYIRETEAVVTAIIKEFLTIFAENRMTTLMSYESFQALNEECPQSKREEFRSCIEE